MRQRGKVVVFAALIIALLPALGAAWQNTSATGPSSEKKAIIDSLRAKLRTEPDNSDIYYRLSVYTDNLQEKISMLQTALRLDPAHYRAGVSLANSFLREGRISEAMDAFRNHLRASQYGGRESGFLDLGFCVELERAGNLREAVACHEQVLLAAAKESAFERCYLFLGTDLRLYSEFPDFVKTVQMLRPYCTNAAHLNKAVILLNEGEKDAALRELMLQMRENPLYQETYSLAAQVYRGRGEERKVLDAAKEYFNVEKDVEERCRMYARLIQEVDAQYDETFLRGLRRECQNPQRGVVK